MFNAETEVGDHSLCKMNFSSRHQTQRLHVRIPSVQFVESTAGNNKWNSLQSLLSSLGIDSLFHSDGKEARLRIEVSHVLRGDFLGQQTDIETNLRSVSCNLAIVLVLLRSSMWDVDPRTWIICPILRVFASDFNDRTVNHPRKVSPEFILDQSGETIDGILVYASFIKGNLGEIILLGQVKLL